MTEEIFRTFARTALWTPAVDQSAWIIMDLFAAHRCAEVRKILHDKRYYLKYIPAGCTSKIQAHDVVLNRPFKSAVERAYAQRLKKEGTVNRGDVCDFVKAGMAGMKLEMIDTAVFECILHEAVWNPAVAPTMLPQRVLPNSPVADRSDEAAPPPPAAA